MKGKERKKIRETERKKNIKNLNVKRSPVMWAQPRHSHTFHTGVKGSNSRSPLWFHKTHQGTTTSETRAGGKQQLLTGVTGRCERGQRCTWDESSGLIWVSAMREKGPAVSALHLTPAGDRFPEQVSVRWLDQFAPRCRNTDKRQEGGNIITSHLWWGHGFWLNPHYVIHTVHFCIHRSVTKWMKATQTRWLFSSVNQSSPNYKIWIKM